MHSGRDENREQPADGRLGALEEYQIDLNELHPPMLVDFDLLRNARPGPSFHPIPEHDQIPTTTTTTETEAQSSSTSPPPPSAVEPSASSTSIPNGTFGTIYQQSKQQEEDPQEPAQPTTQSGERNMPSEIAVADGEESDDEMLLPESIRGAFLFRRSACHDPQNTVLSGDTPGGRIFRQPRLRKIGGRKRLADLADDEALDQNTRHRRERKRVRRRRREEPELPAVPVVPELPAVPVVPDILEDETLDLEDEGSMEWNGGPNAAEQQQQQQQET